MDNSTTNAILASLSALNNNFEALQTKVRSIKGDVSNMGRRLDNIEGWLNSTISAAQNYHDSSSRHDQSTFITISPEALYQMHNPPRPIQDLTTQATAYP